MDQKYILKRNYTGVIIFLLSGLFFTSIAIGLLVDEGVTVFALSEWKRDLLSIYGVAVCLVVGSGLLLLGAINIMGILRNPEYELILTNAGIYMPGMRGGKKTLYQYSEMKSFKFAVVGELHVIEIMLDNGSRVNIPKQNLQSTEDYESLKSDVSLRLGNKT